MWIDVREAIGVSNFCACMDIEIMTLRFQLYAIINGRYSCRDKIAALPSPPLGTNQAGNGLNYIPFTFLTLFWEWQLATDKGTKHETKALG